VIDKSGHRGVEDFDDISCWLKGELRESDLEPEGVGSLWDLRLRRLVHQSWHPVFARCRYSEYVCDVQPGRFQRGS